LSQADKARLAALLLGQQSEPQDVPGNAPGGPANRPDDINPAGGPAR
jgi:hypothetical protein